MQQVYEATAAKQITLKEILQRPIFQNITFIGSEEALKRTVDWVHVIEVAEVEQLLNGRELILTTGVGWHNDEGLSLSFLNQLIESGAAGLCIELGTYTNRLPEAMVQTAKAWDFPLILFHEQVRYVDITQELHAFFIHRQYTLMRDLEILSQTFNQMLLHGRGVRALLQELRAQTGLDLFYLPVQGESEFVPEVTAAREQQFVRRWLESKTEDREFVLHKPIMVLDQYFADIVVCGNGRELTSFEELAVDRCATAVAQEVMRTAYMEERKRYRDEMWIHEWLSGDHHEEKLRRHLISHYGREEFSEACVCVMETSHLSLSSSALEAWYVQKAMVARAAFEEKQILFLSTVLPQGPVYVLLDTAKSKQESFSKRMYKAFEQLRKTEAQEEKQLYDFAAFGKCLKQTSQIWRSFETAKETMAIQRKIGRLPMPFYENLHLLRTVHYMEEQGDLEDYIQDYLGEVISYDAQKNVRLLQTLKVYLECFGSKQATAKRLFVVRQTLYHRLDKIQELLGEDILEAPKRLSIELAIHAYEYKYGSVE
ncbi:PucR family transcriptional regulator [Marinococcus sp. PL1-022]|uniref:PucR family transcriptional regulator n=1 Tax=Marinococcus sp. PL1-022 TaxID=3095363 RepID=UPI0029C491EB|nr:PucR family transcriptional regulator [Marinococcus sp. PL1-022]MDX6153876.1 PucR family transcriptional regulator [Marinococcus sp. PL1-022]